MNLKPQDDEMYFSINPHPQRKGWAVLRVKYDRSNPEHQLRISRAMTNLSEPFPDEGKQEQE